MDNYLRIVFVVCKERRLFLLLGTQGPEFGLNLASSILQSRWIFAFPKTPSFLGKHSVPRNLILNMCLPKICPLFVSTNMVFQYLSHDYDAALSSFECLASNTDFGDNRRLGIRNDLTTAPKSICELTSIKRKWFSRFDTALKSSGETFPFGPAQARRGILLSDHLPCQQRQL